MPGNLGPTKTWKIAYHHKTPNARILGIAFVEADTLHWAMYTFQKLYAGQFFTIVKCDELFKH